MTSGCSDVSQQCYFRSLNAHNLLPAADNIHAPQVAVSLFISILQCYLKQIGIRRGKPAITATARKSNLTRDVEYCMPLPVQWWFQHTLFHCDLNERRMNSTVHEAKRISCNAVQWPLCHLLHNTRANKSRQRVTSFDDHAAAVRVHSPSPSVDHTSPSPDPRG